MIADGDGDVDEHALCRVNMVHRKSQLFQGPSTPPIMRLT